MSYRNFNYSSGGQPASLAGGVRNASVTVSQSAGVSKHSVPRVTAPAPQRVRLYREPIHLTWEVVLRNAPRIAFVDIETAPNLGWVWGKWEQNVIDFKKSWYVLSYAVKWQGQRRVATRALPDYPLFRRDMENDRELVKDLHRVFDEADIIIAHNGDRFDIKKANARFIQHGLKPPAQYKSIDTLKIARKHFKFDSNKLDDLGKYLGVGRKLPHTGAHLWFSCMSGKASAWRIMRRYNARDVELLERVYLKLRPWATTHPNLNLYANGHNCPTCQSENIKKKGFQYLRSTVRQRMLCLDCGAAWSGELIK